MRQYLWDFGFLNVIEWIISIAKGIFELERLGIFHCDLNLRNTIKIGSIFKIIDFGRAIYKFKGVTVCSDSFHKNGDAGTQYNFEPYFNNKKPPII